MTSCALVALLLLAPQTPAPPSGSKVIDVRATRPPAGNTFEALWWTYRRAAQRGDNDAAATALREISKMRVERNVVRLEPFALARVAQGLARLREGQVDKADAEFTAALAFDPHLADGHFGLAQSARRKGVAGLWSAARHGVAGFTARLGSISGQHYLFALLVPAGVLALLLTITLLAAALMLRSGRLLLHELEETLGPERRTLARTLLAILLALPVLALQGWGWLPLWWLALMFLYLTNTERVVVGAAMLATLAIVPLAHMLDERMATGRNPLFQAGLAAIEGGPDARATALLEKAAEARPQDKDLPYLVGALYKKGGRYEDAAALYNTLLQANASDAYALNNLGNLSFAAAEFQAAVPRYQQGLAAEPSAEVAATLYYNMSLAHLQKFERQPANEDRSQADRLSRELTRRYETTWRYDFSNEGAVVDLRPSAEELWRKFFGRVSGVARENVSGSRLGGPSTAMTLLTQLPNRFAAAMIVFGLTILGLSRWRGPRAFTMRCVKCGTPFCRRCHIGPASSGLCTQCHHLFVVRDGVSGPARNQKLLEVQNEDKRRELVFRVLSLLAPGAGHAYARRVLSGLGFLFAWAALLSLALVAGLLLPFTDAPSMIAPSWGWAVGAVVLLAVYVAANRARPDFEVFIPAGRQPRQPRRRGRAA
jgi:tetratricopeptide (TPR) repeat protein